MGVGRGEGWGSLQVKRLRVNVMSEEEETAGEPSRGVKGHPPAVATIWPCDNCSVNMFCDGLINTDT